MEYRIFELNPESRIERDGYDHNTILNQKLEEPEYNDTFGSYEEAENYLKENATNYIGCDLVILSVYHIDYNGELR